MTEDDLKAAFEAMGGTNVQVETTKRLIGAELVINGERRRFAVGLPAGASLAVAHSVLREWVQEAFEAAT